VVCPLGRASAVTRYRRQEKDPKLTPAESLEFRRPRLQRAQAIGDMVVASVVHQRDSVLQALLIPNKSLCASVTLRPDYYACLHVGNATHLLRRTLLELERDLVGSAFCRIHRSVIVNLNRIRGLELKDDGEYEIVLVSGARLRLSRRFRKNLQDRLGVGSRRA